jgi:peptidyl-dipeptidase A
MVLARGAVVGLLSRAMQKTDERLIERQRFLREVSERLAPIFAQRGETVWTLSTTGETEATEAFAAAKLAVEEALADPEMYLAVKRFTQDGPSGDDGVDRELDVLGRMLVRSQAEPALLAALTGKEASLRQVYGSARGEIDGKPHSSNELELILGESDDAALRESAWSATKQVGDEVREQVIEIVETRNQIATSLGYRDHYAMSLELQELSEKRLFATLNKLEKATRTPFRKRKAVHDTELAQRFDISADELMPWHYANPFFQGVPVPKSLKLNENFVQADIVDLAQRFFDGLGMNVRGVVAASDLEPRDGKDQHAFCLHVDRAGDVRVLCNIRPGERWMRTTLHELGHAAYDRYIDQPFLLARPSHTLMTEAVAQLMGRQSTELEFLLHYVGLPAFEVTPLSGEIRRHQGFRMQAFTRFVLVMCHFERELYANPRRKDLDAYWWKLKKKYQLINTPPDRGADWAAKRHLALSPVYYHNYLYGEMVASQLRHVILERSRESTIVDSLFAGQFLINELFLAGNSERWDEQLERISGQELTSQYFVREFTA